MQQVVNPGIPQSKRCTSCGDRFYSAIMKEGGKMIKAMHEVSPADVSREAVYKLRLQARRNLWAFLSAVLMMAAMVVSHLAGAW
jgi:hypothetical protein